MIPTAWQLLLLALGVYRVWRLAALDDMPWLVKARDLLVGATWTAGVVSFRRPVLAHAIQCPWCSGLWVTAAAAAGWFAEPRWVLIAATPFALATLVGALGHHLNG